MPRQHYPQTLRVTLGRLLEQRVGITSVAGQREHRRYSSLRRKHRPARPAPLVRSRNPSQGAHQVKTPWRTSKKEVHPDLRGHQLTLT